MGWLLHFCIQPRHRLIFHTLVGVIYTFESISTIYYLSIGIPFDFGIILAVFARWVLILCIGIAWVYLFNSKVKVEEEDEAMIGFTPPTTWKEYFQNAKRLGGFVWPKGWKWRWMMIASGFCLVIGRIVNVLVPIQYKKIINSLSRTLEQYMVNTELQVLKLIPYDQIMLFVLLRVLGGGSGLISIAQEGLWIPISQFTTKLVATEMLDHLHHLPLSFHLSRKTGEILRVQSRGVSSIVSIVSSFWFKVVPTLCDVAVACVYFTIEFDVWFGYIVVSTMTFYIFVTIELTEWRTKYRRKANRLENAMEAKGVDSLLNYESVKYFNAEGVEVAGYADAVETYQNADWVSQATMWVLDVLQTLIIQFGLLAGCLLCAKRIIIDKTMTVGDFVLFLSYVTQLYGPLGYFGSYYKTIQKNFVDMEKLMDLFDEEKETDESGVALRLDSAQIEFSIPN
jgi:ABC-type multidrug transport system fused ATPase/permease subunit